MSDDIGCEHRHHKQCSGWLKIRLPVDYLETEEWKQFVECYDAEGASELRAEATRERAVGDRGGELEKFRELQILGAYVVSGGRTFPPGWRAWRSGIPPSPLEVSVEFTRRMVPLLEKPATLSALAEKAASARTQVPGWQTLRLVEVVLGIFVERERRLPTKNELCRECHRFEMACGTRYEGDSLLAGFPAHGDPIDGGRAYVIGCRDSEAEQLQVLVCPDKEWNEDWEREANASKFREKLGLGGLPKKRR